jgi:hypothetical protein
MNKSSVCGMTFGLLVTGLSSQAFAVTVNFDDQGLSGPSIFASAGPAQTLDITTSDGNVQFKGGVILTNTTNLPANQTSIYGTASFGDPSLSNPLTIKFANSIQNFFLDVYNGNTEDITYTVADNSGNSETFTLAPNLDGGTSQIGFAAVGTEVTITSSIGSSTAYDFFIDNITFNEALPPNLGIPEPSSVLGTVAFGLLGGTVLLNRKRKRANFIAK